MLRRIGVLTSLVVVAVMFAGISSAQAQIPNTGICIFEGLSGTLNAGTSAHGAHGHGIQNIASDIANLTPNDVERGSYNFTTAGGAATAVCAGVFNGAPVVEPNASITSDGFYDNILCGNGFAHDLDGDGTVVAGTTDPNLQIGPGEAGYEIPFHGGEGPLFIGPDGKSPLAAHTDNLPPDNQPGSGGLHGDHDPDGNQGPPPPANPRHGNVVSAYTGIGWVAIEPQLPDNCVNAQNPEAGNLDQFGDTDGFTVQGFFVGSQVP